MIKVIFFDFWGTLVENGVWSPIKQVRTILGINAPFEEYVVRMEKAMMTTKFESLREAFQALCDEFNITPTNEQMDSLVGMWNKSWMLAKPYDETISTLQRLQKKYDLVLVSNTDGFSIDSVLEKFGLRQYFKEVFLSYEIGKIKTDKEFFPLVLKNLGVQAEECMMVGDSIQSDIIPAQLVGIKAVLLDRRNQREAEVKITNLSELENL